MMTTALHPNVLYAQDKTKIYLTIDLQDAEEHQLDALPGSVKFSCNKAGTEYAFELELFDSVKDWSVHATKRNIALTALKENSTGKFWPRLQKSAGKLNFVKTDFSKWVDEDEDSEAEDPQSKMNEQLMNMMSMGGAGGMPDMGSMMKDLNVPADSDDEEDEKMPELAEAK